jgi:hypothetical protein
MHLSPIVIIAIIAGLVLLGFCLQMLANDGNPDWDELATKYPVATPFSGSWTEGHCDLGAPSDTSDPGKLGMGGEGIYIEPKTGKAVYIPFGQVKKAERIDLGDGKKPICYLHLDGDFKISLPDDFVKSAGDKVAVLG